MGFGRKEKKTQLNLKIYNSHYDQV